MRGGMSDPFFRFTDLSAILKWNLGADFHGRFSALIDGFHSGRGLEIGWIRKE
jgi:hypothetical protein